MEGSRVMQSLDSLWFCTNILTRRDEAVASVTDQFTPFLHAKEPPMGESEEPITPYLLNQQNESRNVENFSPKGCPKCGELLSEAEAEAEAEMVIPVNIGMVESRRETAKRRRGRKRGGGSGPNGMRKILGGLEMGFDVKGVTGSCKFQQSWGYHQRLGSLLQTRMLPFGDDMAMKEHLKSWAYAVACIVK